VLLLLAYSLTYAPLITTNHGNAIAVVFLRCEPYI